MRDTVDWDLIAGYLAGDLSDDQKKLFLAWLEADPENARTFELLEKAWTADIRKLPKSDVDGALQNVLSKSGLDSSQIKHQAGVKHLSPGSTRKSAHSVSSIAMKVTKIAAVLILTTIASFYAYQWLGEETTPDLKELFVENKQRANFRLSDGTAVTLDAGSKFSYPENFSGQTREVYLNGEGFFEVAHNPDKPFIVHANHATVKVLGTKFNIRSWSEEHKAEVFVSDGSVSFRLGQAEETEAVILTKGQMSTLPVDGKPSEPANVGEQRFLAWLDYKMVFEQTPLKEVLHLVHRWHNVEFVLTDTTNANLLLTAEFQNDPLEDIVQAVSAALELVYSIEGDIITFSPKK